MTLTWVREDDPVWDADKQRVIGGAPEGTFVLSFSDGDALPGEWWSARDGEGLVVGYGRLDIGWGGDAEILLAVDPGRQQEGIGSFVLAGLEDEAGSRGHQLRLQHHPAARRPRARARLARRAWLPGLDRRRPAQAGRRPVRVAVSSAA